MFLNLLKTSQTLPSPTVFNVALVMHCFIADVHSKRNISIFHSRIIFSIFHYSEKLVPVYSSAGFIMSPKNLLPYMLEMEKPLSLSSTLSI
jgi:hypothetical protein